MHANVIELLDSLQSTGFRDIAGSRASARIPVSRSLVNRVVAQVLQETSTVVREVDVRPREGDVFDLVITLSWPFVPRLKVGKPA